VISFTELLHFKASDGTEMSVWSAPVELRRRYATNDHGHPTATADIGIAALEYSGLSTAAGTAVVDQTAQALARLKRRCRSTPHGGDFRSKTSWSWSLRGLRFENALMGRMGFNTR